MLEITFKFTGTTPKKFVNEMANLRRNIQRRLIDQPARTLAGRSYNGLGPTTEREVKRVVQVPQWWLKESEAIKVNNRSLGSRGRVVTVRLRSRNLPLAALRPNYRAGREAGFSGGYGGGTAYTIYKGQRQTARNVWQKPSAANPTAVQPGGTFFDNDAYLTREKGAERFPVRRWRGLTISNYYRNDTGRRQLPALKAAFVSRIKHVSRIQAARLLTGRVR